MTNLSDEQSTLRASITKNAIIWAIILGLIVAGLAYWLLGSQGAMIRAGGAVVAGGLVAGLVYMKSMASGASEAKCAKCGAAFSVSRSDRQETLVKSDPREERKTLDNGDIEITTWLQEVYDVDDTFSCSGCADTSHKTYQTSRKRDEETRVKSTGSKKSGEDGKGNSQSKSKSIGKNKK